MFLNNDNLTPQFYKEIGFISEQINQCKMLRLAQKKIWDLTFYSTCGGKNKKNESANKT